MRYILITIQGKEHVDAWLNGSVEDKEAEIEATRAWFREHGSAGRITGGEELSWPHLAKTVRKKGISDGPFAVTGTKDGSVYVWSLPNEEEINNHRITKNASGGDLTLSLVERAVEAGKVRVGVNLDNPESAQFPQGRLVPGRRMTLVIQQQQ